MNVYVVGAYVAYLTISISLTVWVARTLVKNGRIFLVDSFLGNEGLADSVNHLLAVGFYLVNVGYVSLALKYGDKPADLAQAIESLSTKVGLVLLVLGVHAFPQPLRLLADAPAGLVAESEAAGFPGTIPRARAGVESLKRSRENRHHRSTHAARIRLAVDSGLSRSSRRPIDPRVRREEWNHGPSLCSLRRELRSL